MAALRQLLSARAMAASQDRTTPSPTEEEQRRAEAKMQVMGYSKPPPAVPSKSPSTGKSSPDQQRQLHSQYHDTNDQQWQHPLLRKNPSNNDMGNSYVKSNSFDHGSNFNRPQVMRSHTETKIPSLDGSEQERSSFYEENESPALSPALNKHLALRPLNTSAPSQNPEPNPYSSPQKTHQRRRSRSATQDGYYGATENAWDGYGGKTHKPRQDSLQGPKPMKSSLDSEQSGVMQLLRDRNVRSPQQEQNSRFDPQPLDMIGAKSPNDGRVRKEAHTFTNTSSSPTSSITSSASADNSHHHQNNSNHRNPHKRQRSLDYTPASLSSMDYTTLATESFDHIPSLPPDTLTQTHNLPSASLPLTTRLQQIYPDKTHKDRAHRARIFFASLPIEQYEECGDLLLDGFKDIMERLKQARQQKRKAARAMEEQVGRREEWVRRKRGVLEVELQRLKSSGSAVVKPAGKKGRGKGSI